ncbi:glycosyltransferase family 4 protein [Candidatus Collierbacteria bacterium]|nr:glycosyltransferase family 4 protein [Candidatus Collierbacteria bacterium]
MGLWWQLRNNMNILFLTPRDSKTNLGGVEGHVRILTEELEKRGHKVKELSLEDRRAPNHAYFGPEASSLALPKSAVSGFGRSSDILSLAPKYRDRPKRFGKIEAWVKLWKNRGLFNWAEVIHVHDVFWWYFPFAVVNKGLALLRQQGQAFAGITFHGWEGVYPPSRSAVWQKKLATWLSNGTIGVGSFFKKWYGVETDRVVWGAVNLKVNKGLAFRLAKGQALRKIVFLGRLEEVNGIETVMEAMDKLINRQIDKYTNRQIDKLQRDSPRFVFIGDGSYRKQAEKFGRVTGMVKDPQKYLVAADVVITSSYISMLEAAAMGKPIIAIANNPLKEDYLNCHPLRKYIKVVKNVEELIKIIRGLNKGLASPQQQGQALKNANRWATRQTAEKLADEYESLWKISIN